MSSLLKNWNALRIIRLIAGLGIIFMSVAESQIILSIIGLLLLVQAVMNFGCSANGCDLPSQRRSRRQN